MENCKQYTSSHITFARGIRRFHKTRTILTIILPSRYISMLHIVNSGSKREVQKTKRREKIRFASIPSDAYLYTRGVHRYLAHRRMSKLRLARESEFLPRVCTLQKESDGGSDGREARVESGEGDGCRTWVNYREKINTGPDSFD